MDQFTRRGRVEVLFIHHHFEILAGKWQTSGQRLINHHAHAVPIAGSGDRKLGPLLRRHVIGRTGERNAVVKFLALDFRD